MRFILSLNAKTTKNLVDIYSPYNYDPLSAKDETISVSKYQKINGLKNKKIENKINSMIGAKVKKLESTNIKVVSKMINNFENTVSIIR